MLGVDRSKGTSICLVRTCRLESVSIVVEFLKEATEWLLILVAQGGKVSLALEKFDG